MNPEYIFIVTTVMFNEERLIRLLGNYLAELLHTVDAISDDDLSDYANCGDDERKANSLHRKMRIGNLTLDLFIVIEHNCGDENDTYGYTVNLNVERHWRISVGLPQNSSGIRTIMSEGPRGYLRHEILSEYFNEKDFLELVHLVEDGKRAGLVITKMITGLFEHRYLLSSSSVCISEYCCQAARLKLDFDQGTFKEMDYCNKCALLLMPHPTLNIPDLIGSDLKEEISEDGSAGVECVICQDSHTDPDRWVVLNSCCHRYHHVCFRRYSFNIPHGVTKVCPQCKVEYQTDIPL
jgi:hypothetical protein